MSVTETTARWIADLFDASIVPTLVRYIEHFGA